MNDQFKVGDIVGYGGNPGAEAYVVKIEGTQMMILFFDGSCGWHNLEPMSFTRTGRRWDPDKIRGLVEDGLFKRDFAGRQYIDNLTYVEILNQLNERTESK
jgi:hypothetical protein